MSELPLRCQPTLGSAVRVGGLNCFLAQVLLSHKFLSLAVCVKHTFLFESKVCLGFGASLSFGCRGAAYHHPEEEN